MGDDDKVTFSNFEMGVVQGGSLSPALFIIFVHAFVSTVTLDTSKCALPVYTNSICPLPKLIQRLLQRQLYGFVAGARLRARPYWRRGGGDVSCVRESGCKIGRRGMADECQAAQTSWGRGRVCRRSQFMCGTEFHQVSMVVLLLGSMVVLL